jgi:hypothetical protein
VKGRGIVLYPDADIRLAFNRAIAIETSRGWRIAKEKASHKIDVVVALAMSAHGAVHKGAANRQVVVTDAFLADLDARFQAEERERAWF